MAMGGYYTNGQDVKQDNTKVVMSEPLKLKINPIKEFVQEVNPTLSHDDAEKFARDIESASDKYGVDAELIAALLGVGENRFYQRTNPSCRYDRNCPLGYGQIRPITYRSIVELKDWNSYNLNTRKGNIHATAQVLAFLLEKNDGDVKKALVSYNAGQSHVSNYVAWQKREHPVLQRKMSKEEWLKAKKFPTFTGNVYVPKVYGAYQKLLAEV